MSTVQKAGVRRAWGWVAALREGSTTAWSQWAGEAEPSADRLPGAHQLELLRRLNATGPDGVRTEVADRVLAAGLPGRGRSDVPLVDAGEPPQFGPAPVDPADLGETALLRLASGLLAEDLAGCAPPVRRHPRRRPWASPYQLAGDEWWTSHLRADLRRLGRPEQDHPRHVYVVGGDLATMLSHAWTARAFAESGAGWETWLGRFVEEDLLPGRADLLAPARGWAAAIGTHRVSITLDPLRLRRPLRLLRHRFTEPPPVTAAGVDLARRTSTTLGILVPDRQRRTLLRDVLLPRLPQDPAAVPAVPDRWLPWVQERAARMRADLLADGYPVLGDPGRLETVAGRGQDPDEAEVLALALRLLTDPAPTRTEEAR